MTRLCDSSNPGHALLASSRAALPCSASPCLAWPYLASALGFGLWAWSDLTPSALCEWRQGELDLSLSSSLAGVGRQSARSAASRGAKKETKQKQQRSLRLTYYY